MKDSELAGQNFRGFAEKVALVTGGAHGVGRAIALQLALEGAFVVIQHDSNDGQAAEVVSELQALGTIAFAVEGDVSSPTSVRAVFDTVEQAYGRLDLLVNVFDEWPALPVSEISDAAWRESMAGGIDRCFACCGVAERLMRNRPSGSIVNVFSSAVETIEANSLAGAVNASGLAALTSVLGAQLKPKIRVNAVELACRDGESASNDDVARACVYLLSSEAKAINGRTLKVG